MEQLPTREVPFRARTLNDPPPPAWELTDEQKDTRAALRVAIADEAIRARDAAIRDYCFAAQALTASYVKLLGVDACIAQRMGLSRQALPPMETFSLPYPYFATQMGFRPIVHLGREYIAHSASLSDCIRQAATEAERTLRTTHPHFGEVFP